MASNKKDLLESCEELDLEQDHSGDDFNVDVRVYLHQAVNWLTQPNNPIIPLLVMGIATAGLGGAVHPMQTCC